MNRNVHPEPSAKPRVGYVLKRFPRLSETFILNEILELERQGVHVEVFSLLKPPDEPRHGLFDELAAPITYLPGSSVLDAWTVRNDAAPPKRQSILEALPSRSVEFQPLFSGKTDEEIATLHLKATTVALLAKARGLRHLHAHFGSDATTVALLASRLGDIPFSYTTHARDLYHTYVDPESDLAMRRAKLAEAEFVVTVSDYNKRHLVNLTHDSPRGPVHRIYNGIDLSRFRPSPDGREERLILAVGRLIAKKGFSNLVQACASLRDAGVEFRCILVGDGPERDSLQSLVDTLDLKDRFSFAGTRRQEELVELLQRAAVVTLPCVVTETGDRDGLPTVLLEAMAAGIPVVTTTVSGGPEIVDDGRDGYLVPPGEPEQLARRLTDILTVPGRAREMGQNARAKAEERFDLRNAVAQLHGYFADTVRRNQPQLRIAG